MATMWFLVTGGAGFIGSHLVDALLKQGHAVRVLDNLSTGRRDNLAGSGDAVELIEGDVRSYHIVQQAVRGIDVVLHQAALPSVSRSVTDPITTNEVNITGTLNVLEASRQAGVRRVVYASSSSIYGDSDALPKHEGMTPNPLSPYAVSKLAGENYCRVFSRLYALETVSLRYFNVFGPRQDPRSFYSAVIPRFIHAVLHGERPCIYGDGEQSRDFTYVANVVQANLLAATAEGASGLVMNCACNERTSLNALLRAIQEVTGRQVPPEYRPPRPGDIKHSLASIDLARETIGYVPEVGFADGLRMTIDAYRHQVERDERLRALAATDPRKERPAGVTRM
jgi:nucleoside-diphosphate-sugar epimerase